MKAQNIYRNVIFLALVIIISFTWLYWTLPDIMLMKLSGYIQILTLSIFSITCIIGINTYKNQLQDRFKAKQFQYYQISQGKVADIDRMFMSNPNLDRLYIDMYKIHKPMAHVSLAKSKQFHQVKDNPDLIKLEYQASNIIFHKICDIYVVEQLKYKPISKHNIEWINTFRGWFQSSILRRNWKYLKYEYNPQFRDFVDKVLISNNKFIK